MVFVSNGVRLGHCSQCGILVNLKDVIVIRPFDLIDDCETE